MCQPARYVLTCKLCSIVVTTTIRLLKMRHVLLQVKSISPVLACIHKALFLCLNLRWHNIIMFSTRWTHTLFYIQSLVQEIMLLHFSCEWMLEVFCCIVRSIILLYISVVSVFIPALNGLEIIAIKSLSYCRNRRVILFFPEKQTLRSLGKESFFSPLQSHSQLRFLGLSM